MNLLVLSTWFPYPADNGSRLRAFHLLRGLHEAGHTIRLVAGLQSDLTPTVQSGIPAPLSGLCAFVRAVPWHWHEGSGGIKALLSPIPASILQTPNPELTSAIVEELARKPDAVLVMELGMDAYIPPTSVPLVLEQAEVSGWVRSVNDAPNSKARLRALLTQAKARAYWRKRFARYQAITAVSEEEARAVRAIARTVPVEIVPNGVDVGAFGVRDPACVKPLQLVYNGSPTYKPNRDAVLWFAREILPRVRRILPDVRLCVTGRFDANDTELTGLSAVQLTGFLPDVRLTVAESSVCVVPLRSGGGTRLKILEAWAANVPVVSTPVGAAGLGAKDGMHLLLAQTEADFANAVLRLLQNLPMAQQIADTAHMYVAQTFDWRIGAARLNELLTRVAARSS